MQWLKTQKVFELDADLFARAVSGGHLKVSKWLRSEGCPWDEIACMHAAMGGHLDVLK